MPTAHRRPSDISAKVRSQYEGYPYPYRDPEEERKRLIIPFMDSLQSINQYCYRGRRDFRQGFRALVAGGGTGDAVVFLAAQLRHYPNSEVVYIDLSEASMHIAQERARIRGLDNIRWHHGSLLDLPKMGLGTFDYINCSGVLHHLPDPDAGLAALAEMLTDDGCMGIMIYGQYGRTAVYQMQELMRRIHAACEVEDTVRIQDTREMLECLPPGNWMARDMGRWKHEFTQWGDIGVYDVVLHAQDRAYTVPQVYDWVERHGLQFVDFMGDGILVSKLMYDPLVYLGNTSLAERIRHFPLRRRQAIAELVSGILRKHTFYVSRMRDTILTPDHTNEKDIIPYFSIQFDQPTLKDIYNKAQADELAMIGNGRKNLLPENSAVILRHLDGKKTLSELYQAMQQDAVEPLSLAEARERFAVFYQSMFNHELLFLRHVSASPPLSFAEVKGIRK